MTFLPPRRRSAAASSPPPPVLLERLYRRLLTLLAQHRATQLPQLLQTALGSQAAVLQPLQDLAAVTALSAELLHDILPRITRRLSFASHGKQQREALPGRGRVDWPRTLQDQQRTPDAGRALQVITRARRRDFATEENLVTTAVVLDFRQRVQQVLQERTLVSAAAALRHPLQQVLAGCDQVLATVQLTALRRPANELRRNGRLAERAAALLQRHHANRAYHDLADWYARLNQLQLLTAQHAQPQHGLQLLSGNADDLYRCWLTLELLETLPQQDGRPRLTIDPHNADLLVEDAAGTQMIGRFSRNAAAGTLLLEWQRLQPPPQQISADGVIYWREPPLRWHAAYQVDPADLLPIRAADLLATQRGAIICSVESHAATDSDPLIERVPPPIEPARIVPRLHALLARTLQQLAPRPAPACHGTLLDSTADNAAPQLSDRFGAALAVDDAVLCAKPHISDQLIELVSRSRHCCRDGRVCQIIGRPDARPPTRRPRTQDELLRELAQLRLQGPPPPDPADADSAAALDDAVEHISAAVVAMTQQYAELNGGTARLQRYQQQLIDLGLERVLTQLSSGDRQSLSLGFYLRDQLDIAESHDYSAVILHMTRVIENLLLPRLKGLRSRAPDLFSGRHRLGFGSLHAIGRDTVRRQLLHSVLLPDWQPLAVHDDRTAQLNGFLTLCDNLRVIRNDAAHTLPINRSRLHNAMHLIFGSGDGRYGVLHLLVHSWQPVPQ